MHDTTHSKLPIVDAFRRGCKPPTPMEEVDFFTSEALKDLRDESKPERERYNSALRLLCSIRAIHDRMPDAALNEIFGRNGITPPTD